MPASPDRYAVFGNPVKHSKSPLIHRLFAEQTGQNILYTAELVSIDGLRDAVRKFARDGGKGLNITVPFKQQACALVTRKNERAERAGAVNTLILHSVDDYYGDNTDGIGLVRDLVRNHRLNLTGKKILLVGAGGAARGVIEPLLRNRPNQVTLVNRTIEKALQLADAFSDLGPIRGCGFDDLYHGSYDIIINGTSTSLKGTVPPLPVSCLNANTFCYDMMYASEPTAFMQWAKSHGAANTVDGLGMLVEQAAESFKLWRGCEPDTAPVIHALRQ